MDETVPNLAAVVNAADEDVVAGWIELDAIEVTGADAASYLQGQLSQDVEGLAESETRWTFLLQPQGKVDAWMRIHRLGPERFLLLVDRGFGPQAEARLQRFKIRVDAELATTSRAVLALRGPRSTSVAADLVPMANVVAVDAGWNGVGVDLVWSEGGRPAVEIPPGVLTTTADGLETIRVLRGRPAMGSELGESTIPAAAGVVESSVDFTKGCFVGQELVARIDSRGGNTPTFLVRVEVAAPPGDVPAGLELRSDESDGDRAIGVVTTAVPAPGDGAGAVGLGYVKRGTEVPGSASAVLADGRRAAVTLLPQND